MAEPFLSEIRIVSWNFAAKGWALANGQTMPINQNQALFAILGTTFGGNGTSNFLLPIFRAAFRCTPDRAVDSPHRTLGSYGGIESITQQTVQIPQSPVSPVTAHIGNAPQLADPCAVPCRSTSSSRCRAFSRRETRRSQPPERRRACRNPFLRRDTGCSRAISPRAGGR